MNVNLRKIRKGSKLIVSHKDHGELPAFVVSRKDSVMKVERYLRSEGRWMKNGPVAILPQDVVRVVRY